WLETLSRMISALKRSVAWQAEKNAAPRPAIAASPGASARRRSVDHSKAAVSAAIETPMTIPSPIRAGVNERPRAPDAVVGRAASPSARASAVIGEAGGAEADCGEEPGRPGRLGCDDQAAEDGAGRHAGGGGSVQAGEDRPAETALDPRAFGVHRDVDD